MSHKRFSDQIWDAINASNLTRYRICCDISLNQSAMSRFMSHKGNLSMETLDRLAELLELRVVVGSDRKPE
jgi:hypothetical protein